MESKDGIFCRKNKGPFIIAFFLFFCALYIFIEKLNLNLNTDWSWKAIKEISSKWENSNFLPTFCDATVNNFDQGRALQFPIEIKNLCDLKNLVQLKIFQLQNPVNCTVSRKFFCRQNARCGFGCQLHHMGICLFLAIGTNRTFIHQPDVHGFQTMMFGPLLRFSAMCNKTSESFFEKLVDIKGDERQEQELTKSEAVVKLESKEWVRPFTAFAPLSSPNILQSVLLKHAENPHVWWIGQIMTYIFRLNPDTAKSIVKLKSKLHFTHPIVGVHVRRTDKIRTEAQSHDIEEYMYHVIAWYNNYTAVTGKDVVRKVFLATDDIEVYEKAVERFPDYKFLSSLKHIVDAGKKVRYTDEGVTAIAEDVGLLAECDFTVATLSSNVGRLVYELRVANSIHGKAHFANIDTPYKYFGQTTEKFVKYSGLDIQQWILNITQGDQK